MKKNAFTKKYSLLDRYIIDETIRNNMLANKDLFRKYEENQELIRIFLIELESRFDVSDIETIIMETIFKYPDEILKSFITAYLNSSLDVKNKKDCYNDFKKIMFMGNDVIRYVSRNGIITSRNYKNIPEKIIDEKYDELKSGIEMFHNELLENVFRTLSISKKEFIVSLLEKDSFLVFKECFEKTPYNLISILNLIENLNIPSSLFYKSTYEIIGLDGINKIIMSAIDSNDLLFITNITSIIRNNKCEFLNKIIDKDRLSSLNEITNEEIESISFDDKYLENLDIDAYLNGLRQNSYLKLKETA